MIEYQPRDGSNQVIDDSRVVIAVIGASGSGKSTFINLVSGSNLLVSDGQSSCTQEVVAAPDFQLDGRTVSLIDTPGFNDSDRSDAEILKTVALFMAGQNDRRLHGVIYLHRIADLRTGGISTPFFRIFKKICDDDTLRSLAIAEWDMYDESREQQFTNERFFKTALHQEAHLFRHDNTIKSAQKILCTICKNHPMLFNIQRELVGERKELSVAKTGRDIGELDVVSIAILGATGSGKSTFINLVSGSHLLVSDDITSGTQNVDVAPDFQLDGRTVRLIDTPGFDDSDRSDAEILETVVTYLADQYRMGTTLHGVIYLHRITDFRMGGISRRSFRLFRKICGDDTLKNVVLVTTRWDVVPSHEGERREQELRTDERFFKPALDQQAHLLRHDNSIESAQNIIRTICKNHPMPLNIQRELVDERKQLSDTVAGKEFASQKDGQFDGGVGGGWNEQGRDEVPRTELEDRKPITVIQRFKSLFVWMCGVRERMLRKELEGMRQILSLEIKAIQEELSKSLAILAEHQGNWRSLSEFTEGSISVTVSSLFVKRVTSDIVELQGALVKSTEKFQKIQALLEKPSPTRPGKLLGLRCL